MKKFHFFARSMLNIWRKIIRIFNCSLIVWELINFSLFYHRHLHFFIIQMKLKTENYFHASDIFFHPSNWIGIERKINLFFAFKIHFIFSLSSRLPQFPPTIFFNKLNTSLVSRPSHHKNLTTICWIFSLMIHHISLYWIHNNNNDTYKVAFHC